MRGVPAVRCYGPEFIAKAVLGLMAATPAFYLQREDD